MSRVLPFPTAVALRGQTALDYRWSPVPKNRILDQRDVVLAEAFARAESRAPVAGYARPLALSAHTLIIGEAPHTGLVILGQNLLGLKLGVGELVHGTGNGAITFTTAVPGKAGEVTVSIAASGGSLTVTADREERTVVVTHSTSTAAQIATAINDDAVAKYLVNAVAGGTGGTAPPDLAATAIVGTSPSGVEFSADVPEAEVLVAGVPLNTIGAAGNGITSWSESEVTFDIDITDLDGEGFGPDAGNQLKVHLVVEGAIYDAGTLVIASA